MFFHRSILRFNHLATPPNNLTWPVELPEGIGIVSAKIHYDFGESWIELLYTSPREKPEDFECST